MKKKGITLIELIIAIAIMSIFSLGVYSYASAQYNIYKKQDMEVQLQFDAKLAVTSIANDIKKSRFTEYSVQTNYADSSNSAVSKIQLKTGIFNGLFPSDVYPIVYIENNNTSCMYAVEQDGATYKLLKYSLTTNKYTLGEKHRIYKYSPSDYNNTNNFNDVKKLECLNNLSPKKADWNDENVKYIYEEYGCYYIVYGDSDDNMYLYNLIPKASTVTLGSPSVIADNVDYNPSIGTGVTVKSTDIDSSTGEMPANAENSSFNINVSLKKNITINGNDVSIEKSFSTCASRGRYDGGDTDDNSYN